MGRVHEIRRYTPESFQASHKVISGLYVVTHLFASDVVAGATNVSPIKRKKLDGSFKRIREQVERIPLGQTGEVPFLMSHEDLDRINELFRILLARGQDDFEMGMSTRDVFIDLNLDYEKNTGYASPVFQGYLEEVLV